MSTRSFDPFASLVTDLRPNSEIAQGGYDVVDLAARLAEVREHLEAAAPVPRRDDRPAGRMTLLPAG
jgi:hypothetical protein